LAFAEAQNAEQSPVERLAARPDGIVDLEGIDIATACQFPRTTMPSS